MFWGFGFETILILGLASFRLTRLIMFDKIMEFVRAPFFNELHEEGEIYLIPKPKGIKKWIGELFNCYWCTGMWVCSLLLAGYVFLPVISIPVILVLAIAAIGGITETVISKWLGQ